MRFVWVNSMFYDHTHSSAVVQTALSREAKRTAAGPHSGHALKLVAEGVRVEHAASLHLQMAARIV